MPEMLLKGRMDDYVGYFLDNFSYNQDAISYEEGAVYVRLARASRTTDGRP